jgi:hypothetical protein
VLEPNSDAPLQVYAVWVDQFGGTRADIDPAFFADARVTTFWDPDGLVGETFREEVRFPGPVFWDAYVVFGPEARWEVGPPRGSFVGAGWTVIGASDQLRRDLERVGFR